MNPCEYYEPMLDLLLDGLLTPSEEAEVRAHLDGCPACAARLRELTELKAALAGLDTDAPAELHGRIMAAVAAEAPKKPEKTPWFKRLTNRRTLGAVAACAVLALGVTVWRVLPMGSKSAPQYDSADACAPESFAMSSPPAAAPDARSESAAGSTAADAGTLPPAENGILGGASESELPADGLDSTETTTQKAAGEETCAAARCFDGDLETLRAALPEFDWTSCTEGDGVLELTFLTGSAEEEQFLSYLTEHGWTERILTAEELPALDGASPYTRYTLCAR